MGTHRQVLIFRDNNEGRRGRRRIFQMSVHSVADSSIGSCEAAYDTPFLYEAGEISF